MKQQESEQDKENKIIKYVNIAALIFGAAILFGACENDIEKIKAFDSSEIRPVVRAENYETTFTDSGIVRFYLTAPILERYDDMDGDPPFSEFPAGVEIIRYDNRGNISSRITSRYAKQLVKEKKWEARNDVVILTEKGDTIKTDFLIFDERDEKAYNNDEYVKVIRPDAILTGYGFEYFSATNYKFKKPTGVIEVEMNTPPREETNVDSTGFNRPVLHDEPPRPQQPAAIQDSPQQLDTIQQLQQP